MEDFKENKNNLLIMKNIISRSLYHSANTFLIADKFTHILMYVYSTCTFHKTTTRFHIVKVLSGKYPGISCKITVKAPFMFHLGDKAD
jgi:hypothetical protein